MSVFKRKLILCLIAMLAGLAVWPVAETILIYQENFSTLLVFNIVLGSVFGAVMGIMLGSSDKMLISEKKAIGKGMVLGALIGAAGGMLGFLISQAVLFLVGEYLIHSETYIKKIAFPISRAIGWGVLGIFIGMGDGIRSKSFARIKVGIIGGISGGLVGGLAFEYLRLYLPNIIYARFFGFIIFGFFIGLFYGFVEKKLSFGILRLLNGHLKGKEFLINQKKTRIGKSAKNDVVLSGYPEVEDRHATLLYKKEELTLKPVDSKKQVRVNDDNIKEHNLRFEDVIQIGAAKFYFKYR